MNVVKVRKNFLLNKDIIEKAQIILLGQQKNLTEVINIYFKAIVKEPSLTQAYFSFKDPNYGLLFKYNQNHLG